MRTVNYSQVISNIDINGSGEATILTFTNTSSGHLFVWPTVALDGLDGNAANITIKVYIAYGAIAMGNWTLVYSSGAVAKDPTASTGFFWSSPSPMLIPLVMASADSGMKITAESSNASDTSADGYACIMDMSSESPTSYTGRVASMNGNNVRLDAGAVVSGTNDFYNDMMMSIRDLTDGLIQTRRITDYVGADKECVLNSAFTFTPAVGDECHIYSSSYGAVNTTHVSGTVQTAGDVVALLNALSLETDLVISSGTIGTVTSKTVFVITDAAASIVNDHYNQHFITVYDLSTTSWQTRVIQDYVGATKTVTLRNALTFTPVITNDTFRIWALVFNEAAVAGGSLNTYTVTDGVGAAGNPIQGVLVWITTDSNGNNVVASGTTDANGAINFYLTVGATYYVWKRLAGYTFADNPESVTAV